MEESYQHGGDIYRNDVLYDFSVNTNPFGMPQKSVEAAVKGISFAKCYPDSQADALREEIANKKQLLKEQILVGNGAAELIYGLCQAIQPQKVLTVSPCFQEYEEAVCSCNGEMQFWNLKEENNFSLEETFIKKITEDIDLVFLCNPNNPTGQLISRQLLEKIAKRCEEMKVWFCLDECFLPFLKEEASYSMLSSICDFPHLMILRAFTKIYGMAGLRLGYGISSNGKLREKIQRVIQPWNTSIPAQMAGVEALKDDAYLLMTRQLIERETQYLMREMQKGLAEKIYEPSVNYIFFKARKDLKERLLEKKILIRSCDNYHNLCRGFFRIAVREREENQALIRAWRDLERK